MSDNPFRKLPSVTQVLNAAPVVELSTDYAHEQVVSAIRDELTSLRKRLAAGESPDGAVSAESVAVAAVARLQQAVRPKLRRVINATGIVLHTNLGRAPMAEEAAWAAYDAAHGYFNLEL